MLEESTKGKVRNVRRGHREGIIFRIIGGLVMVGLLAGLIVVASGLQQAQTELEQLRTALDEVKSAPPAAAVTTGEPSGPAVDMAEFVELKETVASMRSEMANALDQTTREIEATGRDAASDRKTLKMNLARILFQQGASTDDIFPLTVGLSPEERSALLDQLAEMVNMPLPESTGSTGGEEAGGNAEPGTLVATSDGDEPATEATPPLPTKDSAAEATPPEPEPDPEPEPEEEEETYYVVRKGDTIWDIAQKFGVNYAQLLKLNKIRDARKVGIGTKLKIPKG